MDLMTTFENVEKLRERANVTYEEAKQALDACGGDLLDAMIYLENKGKACPPPGGGSYSSSAQPPPEQETYEDPRAAAQPQDQTFGWWMQQIWNFCCSLLHKGIRNNLEVWEKNELWFSLPVLIFVILLLVAFWVVIPALIIGLFCGLRYRFSGRDIDKTPANNVMDSCAKAAENIKEEIRTSWDNPKE